MTHGLKSHFLWIPQLHSPAGRYVARKFISNSEMLRCFECLRAFCLLLFTSEITLDIILGDVNFRSFRVIFAIYHWWFFMFPSKGLGFHHIKQQLLWVPIMFQSKNLWNQAGNHLNRVSLCARFHGTVAGIRRDALTIVDPYKTSAKPVIQPQRWCQYEVRETSEKDV